MRTTDIAVGGAAVAVLAVAGLAWWRSRSGGVSIVDDGGDFDARPMSTSANRVDGQILSHDIRPDVIGAEVDVVVGVSLPPERPAARVHVRIAVTGSIGGIGPSFERARSISLSLQPGEWRVLSAVTIGVPPLAFYAVVLSIDGATVSKRS